MVSFSDAQRVLSSKGWLSRQPRSFQKQLLRGAELIRVPPGNMVYSLDALPNGIFGLVEGLLDVLVAPGPFPTRLVHIARPGWWVGEAAVATSTTRRAELKARTEVLVAHIPVRHLTGLESDEPRLWKYLAGLTVQHLDNALVLAACLSCEDLEVRLAGTLARLSSLAEGSIEVVELPVSHDELGELAGLSRNTVGRVLPRLEKVGCVERRYGLLLINSTGLRKYLQRRQSTVAMNRKLED